MRIPTMPATRSERSRPPIPSESGHRFRPKAATLPKEGGRSERSDAGVG
jgi:hypothetical protein